jgi:hypothetical protein
VKNSQKLQRPNFEHFDFFFGKQQFFQDSELAELKTAMESLRAQSIQAGIGTGLARQPSSDSVSSLSSACSLDKHEKKKKKGWVRANFKK